MLSQLLLLLSVFAFVATISPELQRMSIEEQSKCVDEKYRSLACTKTADDKLSLPEKDKMVTLGLYGNNRKERCSALGSIAMRPACSAVIDQIFSEEVRIEEQNLRTIASWGVNSTEKRVIAFGLYGNKPKYVHGCLVNIKLSKLYYPGWVCRFYVTGVDKSTAELLRNAGGEVVEVESSSSGHMLSRFMVADDPTVDRFIVRDVDSRLNSRERFAVQEWIESGLKIHTMRDHINQFYEYNGGMWGGTKQCMPQLIKNIKNMTLEQKMGGMADIFALVGVWATYKNDTMAHDAYTCPKYIKEGHVHLRAFPTRRPFNYLHVGQVFNENDQPRMNDVDRFLRGQPAPEPCRRNVSWIFG